MHLANPLVLMTWTLLVATAAAQQSRGPFVGLPAALSLDPSAAGPGPATTLDKDAGFASAGVTPGTFTGHDLAAILALHGGNTTPPIDIDDFSTGLDWIQVDDNTGRTAVPPNAWAAITLSLTATTIGTAGSIIAAEAALPGGPGSSIFSYVFTGSALPAALVGRLERAHGRNELGLTASVEVDGLDQLMPMWQLQPEILALLPPQQIYFTVAAGSIGQVPMSWWGSHVPSGAAIFVVSADAAIPWTQPQVWKSPGELGLLNSDDIDGLSIDLLDERILLSTVNPALDPLLFVYYGADGPTPPPQPLKEPNGTPISTKIGLVQNDDVDAICAMDPSISTTGLPTAPSVFIGTPQPPALLPTASMNGSACRSWDGNTVRVHTWLNGWPPMTGQGPGIAALFLTFGSSLSPVYPLGNPIIRNSAPFFVGDPREYQLTVPAWLGFASTPITLRWFAADAGFTELAEAWPVLITL